MAAKKKLNSVVEIVVVLVLLTCAPLRIHSAVDNRLLVNMTLVPNSTASALGAFCLDGSLPAYHLHRGFGAGARNWLLQFEGGGWCNDIPSCLDRAKSRRGSTSLMAKWLVFSGILSNNASLNPDFYNWNRVKIRYCDGASFAGNATLDDGKSLLYFRGQNIWQAILTDLLPKGLANAEKALLSGCSAGGLAVFLHCDNFINFLPRTASVKCLSDGGFFLDVSDIALNHTMRSFYKNLVQLQCFFPQYALKYIETPFFVLNSAYDVFQFHHGLAPPSADIHGQWNRCSFNPAACNANQIDVLQALQSRLDGMFVNSCFAHCQSESQDTWFADDSPRIHDKTIAEAVGDWYYNRRVTKEIDCSYPCDSSCHNLIPEIK
ncbi:hypothetical protein EZV62_005857 [Acer yangbiense]|uniref:Pectin acetylesterase n=1 Tax=Acer yangbiense TaxID=1000413 RepID=A0A5C7IRG2_9ROSI|nr:hypothetical protein EZV62_005857 [Acer yangbiense]